MLLLPGLLCDARLWRDQAASLADIATPVVADLTQDDTIEAMAARAAAAMPPRFALAGLSMGGYVALAVMRAMPERVTRLCLLDTSARADTPEQARRRRGLLALGRTGRFKGVTLRLLPELVHADRLGDAELAGTVIAMAERVGRDAFLRQQSAILARPDARDVLPVIRIPCTVGVGEGDRLTPPDCAREIAAIVPGARLHLFSGCGHLPPLEAPEAVSDVMRRWIMDGP